MVGVACCLKVVGTTVAFTFLFVFENQEEYKDLSVC